MKHQEGEPEWYTVEKCGDYDGRGVSLGLVYQVHAPDGRVVKPGQHLEKWRDMW